MVYVVVPPGRNRPVFMRKKSNTITKFPSDPSSTSHSPRLEHPTKKGPEPPKYPSKGELVMTVRSRRRSPGKKKSPRPKNQELEASSSLLATAGTSVPAEVSDYQISHGYRIVRNPRSLYKHVCGICGTYRSRDYHSRHPLSPGEIPKPTVCTRCAQESESETAFSESRNTSLRSLDASHVNRYPDSRHGDWKHHWRAPESNLDPDSDESEESITVSVDETANSEHYLRPKPGVLVEERVETYGNAKQLEFKQSRDSIPQHQWDGHLYQSSGSGETSTGHSPTSYHHRSRSWSDSPDEFDTVHASRGLRSIATSRTYHNRHLKARKIPSSSETLPAERLRVSGDAHNRPNRGSQEHRYLSTTRDSRSSTRNHRGSVFLYDSPRDRELSCPEQEPPVKTYEQHSSHSWERSSNVPPTNRVRILSIGPAPTQRQDHQQQTYHQNDFSGRFDDQPSSRSISRSTSRHDPPRRYINVEGRYEYFEDPRVAGARDFISDFVRKNTAPRRGSRDGVQTARLESRYGGNDGW